MADRSDEILSPRASGGSGAPSFADFSLFREMIGEEREAARAEHEAAAAEARLERETAAAEQWRLMAEVYELKLQLAEERRSRAAAVQNGTAIGLDGRRHIESILWMESESAPSPTRSQASTSSRNGDSGAVSIWGNAAGWRALVDMYSASTLGAKVQCLQSLTSRRVKPGSNPIPIFAAMIEDVPNMRADGSDFEDAVVCLLFLRALPDEYNVFRQMPERKREELTIDRLRTELRARYDLLKEGKSSKTSDTAFLASGMKRGNSRRRRGKSPQLLAWSFRETSEEKDTGTTRQTFAKYNRFWRPKVIETKSGQNLIFDPGGYSGCLYGCPFWEGDARCIVGGLKREAFAIRYSHLCFFSFSV